MVMGATPRQDVSLCDEGADSRLATAGYRFYAGESVEFAQASALAVGFVTGLVLRWPSG